MVGVETAAVGKLCGWGGGVERDGLGGPGAAGVWCWATLAGLAWNGGAGLAAGLEGELGVGHQAAWGGVEV